MSPANSEEEKVMVKIYSRVLNADTEYKTLSITKSTPCREVIRLLLAKLRIKDRNPNLFYLTIDVVIKNPGVPIKTVMILDDKACPAQLQSVYPYQGTKFTLEMKPEALMKMTGPVEEGQVNLLINKSSTLDSRSSNESTEKEYPCTSRASLTDESCSSTCTLDSCCSCDSSEVEIEPLHHQPLHSLLVHECTSDATKSPPSHIDWPSLYIRLESIQ